MEYSTLDKLGVRVSRLGFGCMRFPLTAEGKIDEPRAAAMLDTAYKAGVTYYDTAYFYHQHTGEAFLGRAMKRYPRDTFYLATKMPMSIVESLDHAKEIFEGQLAALQFLDILSHSDKKASELSAAVRQYPQLLQNVRVTSNEQKAAIMRSDSLREAIQKAEAELGENGRVLIRPSGTEPLIRVMVEAGTQQQAQAVTDRLVQHVENLQKLSEK